MAALVVPLSAYLLIRAAIGPATGALAITEAIPAPWLLLTAVARRRVDPVAILSTATVTVTVTVAIALGAYVLTGGDPLALKLRRDAVTGTLGIAALALGGARPSAAAHGRRAPQQAQPRPPARDSGEADRPPPAPGADDPHRDHRTRLPGGASQTAIALTVPTGNFVADSTAARIVLLGTGLVLTTWYFRHQKERRLSAQRSPASFEPHE